LEDKAHIGNMDFIKEGIVADTLNYSDEVFKENFITSVPVFNNLDEFGIAIKNYEDKTNN
jgi:hypothetical protein